MDSPDPNHFGRAVVGMAAATTVNIVQVTQWLQLVAALAAAVYSVVVLIEWFLKRKKRKADADGAETQR